MSKTKTTFICQNCGTESAKWQGKCPSCNSWNTLVEEIIQKPTRNEVWKEAPSSTTKSKKLSEVQEIENQKNHHA